MEAPKEPWASGNWETNNHEAMNDLLGEVSIRVASGMELDEAAQEVITEARSNGVSDTIIKMLQDTVEYANNN